MSAKNRLFRYSDQCGIRQPRPRKRSSCHERRALSPFLMFLMARCKSLRVFTTGSTHFTMPMTNSATIAAYTNTLKMSFPSQLFIVSQKLIRLSSFPCVAPAAPVSFVSRPCFHYTIDPSFAQPRQPTRANLPRCFQAFDRKKASGVPKRSGCPKNSFNFIVRTRRTCPRRCAYRAYPSAEARCTAG